MYKLFVLVSCFFLAGNASAQVVKGIVVNANNQPVAYATVELQKLGGKQAIKATITDSTGSFEMQKNMTDTVQVKITMPGFSEYRSKAVVFDSLHLTIDLGLIVLVTEAKNLQSVTVVNKRKFIEMQPDKTVLNVENSVLAAGNSVFEVVKKAPAVSVDKDDNLKLKNAVAAIYFDSKPAYLGGQQLTEYLKNTPADVVSKIEIITNPSSRFDAQGPTGIINIKFKKNKNLGFNGSVNAGFGQGRYPKYWGGVNLNFRSKKYNLFGGINSGRYNSFNLLTYNSIIENNGLITHQDRENFWHPIAISHSPKVGMDFFLSKKATLGFLVTGNFSNDKTNTDNNSVFSDQALIATNYINNFTKSSSQLSNLQYNVNYKVDIDSMGSSFNIDGDLATYVREGNDVLTNHFLDARQQPYRSTYVFRNITPATIGIKSFKLDYTKYFKAGFKMETGFKTSFVKTDYTLQSDSLQNEKWVADYNRTNHFIFNENINAAYFNITKEIKKWNIQAGLRAEQTNNDGKSLTTSQVQKNNYISLFPSIFISNKINDKNTLNFSYTRRIQRPGYQNLNPFQWYVDPNTLFEGNPFLQPSFTNSIEIKHGFKEALFTSVSYSHTTNGVVQVIAQNKNTLLVKNRPENASTDDYVSFDVSLSLPVKSWWSVDNSVSVFYGKSLSKYPGYSFNSHSVGASVSTDHTITLPKDYKLQMSAYYNTPYTEGIAKSRSSYDFSIGVQKLILKKQGTIKINFQNLVGPNAYRAHYKSDLLDIVWVNRWDGRQARITFNYKFGKSTVKANRSRTTGAGSEKNRVGFQ
jgi:hypothetical protein